MGSKIGIIISFIFVTLFIILGADMMNIQYIYSDLDAKSVNISYLISKNGLTEKIISYIEEKYEIDFTCLSNCDPLVGESVDFKITKQYKPLVISNEEMNIYVVRQAVIGYFG